MKINTIKKSAFTLIELLVVVAIIGILASVGVPAYSSYQETEKNTSNMSQSKSIVSLIQNEAQKVGMNVKSNIISDLTASKYQVLGLATTEGTVAAPGVNLSTFPNPFDVDTTAITTTTTDLVTVDCIKADGTAGDKLGQININSEKDRKSIIVTYCDTAADNTGAITKSIVIE